MNAPLARRILDSLREPPDLPWLGNALQLDPGRLHPQLET